MRKQHRVTLSNGRILLIEEGNESIHIATETEHCPGVVDYYICQIEDLGVTVMPNSGYATSYITEGLKVVEELEDENEKT